MKKNKLFKTLGVVCGCTAICGVGIGGLVYSTSCGGSSTPTPEPPQENVIPEDAYKIDENNVLKGWVDGWDAETIKDKGYDTMMIPDNVTAIADKAFWNASTQYAIPPSTIHLILNSNLKTIGRSAFSSAPLLSINFSKCKNLESIGEIAFNGKSYFSIGFSSVETIDLSNCTKLKSIGRLAFEDIRSLSSITFPGSLTTIGDLVFGSDGDHARTLNIRWNNLKSLPTTNVDIKAFDLSTNKDIDEGTVKSVGGTIKSDELLAFLQDHGLPKTDNWKAA